MKKNVVAVVVCMVLAGVLPACSVENEKKAEEIVSLMEVEEETDASEKEEMPEAEPEAEIVEEEIPEWVAAYQNFLKDKNNMVSLLLEEGEGGIRGFVTGFYLYDINGDEIPELFVQKDQVADYIYTYTGMEVELRNAVPYNVFGESYFGFDKSSGKAYSVELGSGTGTDRGIGLAELTLRGQVYDRDKTVGASYVEDTGVEWLYNASYGEAEQEGADLWLLWEKAIPGYGCTITKEEFLGIVKDFTPFVYQEISEENIEAYIKKEYKDIPDACSLEEYQNNREKRRQEFWKSALYCEVVDGNMVSPAAMVEVKGEYETVYYDTEQLVCYSERDMAPDFGEEWKQIYWEYMQDIDYKTDLQGNAIVEEEYKESSTFGFVSWPGMNIPVLCINSGIGSTFNCFTIYKNNVVNFAQFGREYMGYSEVALINDTDYCFIYLQTGDPYGMRNSGCLYKVSAVQRDLIWDISWVDADEGIENYFDTAELAVMHDFDRPYCIFMGQEAAKEDAMAGVDKLLGSGAAEQLLNLINYTETGGPLSFSIISLDTWYTWDRILEALDGLSF